MHRRLRLMPIVSSASLLLQLLGQSTPAHATFPGTNGLIAFSSCDTFMGGCYIATVRGDGTGGYAIAGPWVYVYGPAWSPDGTRLAFTANEAGEPFIAVSSATGRHPDKVTSRGTYSPAWSPSGQSIVYTRSTGTNTSDLVIKNLVTGTTRQLTFNQHGVRSEDPDWSPDGTQIVFSRQVGGRHGRWRLFSLTLAGRQLTRLTGDALSPSSPSWSPDGTKVLFSGSDGFLQVLTTSTGHVESLVAGGGGVWSPDGTMVAFSNAGDGWVMPLGGTPTDILHDEEGEFIYSDPAWRSTG